MQRFLSRIDFGIKEVDAQPDGSLILRGYASTWQEDRDRETVSPHAFDTALKRFMSNPILLLQHDVERPLGRVLKATVDSAGLWVEAVVTPPVAEWAKEAYQKIKDGVLKAFSIGGMFFKDGSKIVDTDLMELSVVSIGSNSGALFEVASKAFRIADGKAPYTGDRLTGSQPIPAAGEDGDAPEGSLEDVISDLIRTLQGAFQGSGQIPCLEATFMPNAPGYAVISVSPQITLTGTCGCCQNWCQCDDCPMCDDGYGPMPDMPYNGIGGDREYYRVEFTFDDMGEPVLGKITPKDLAWVDDLDGDADEDLAQLPLQMQMYNAMKRGALSGRKGLDIVRTTLAARRMDWAGRKLGRVFSSSNEQAIRDAVDVIQQSLARHRDASDQHAEELQGVAQALNDLLKQLDTLPVGEPAEAKA